MSYRIHSSNFTINKQKRLDSLIPIIDYLIENFKDIIFMNKVRKKFQLIYSIILKISFICMN